jgi:hypothetical protein
VQYGDKILSFDPKDGPLFIRNIEQKQITSAEDVVAHVLDKVDNMCKQREEEEKAELEKAQDVPKWDPIERNFPMRFVEEIGKILNYQLSGLSLKVNTGNRRLIIVVKVKNGKEYIIDVVNKLMVLSPFSKSKERRIKMDLNSNQYLVDELRHIELLYEVYVAQKN